MAVLFTNNATATLASSITSSGTGITVTSGQGALFPAPTGGDIFYATLINSSNQIEIVKVTARSTDAMTVVRAQEGTTARAYAAADKFELRITAAGLSSKFDSAGGTVAGNLIVTGNTTLGDASGDTTTLIGNTVAVPAGGLTVSGGIVNFAGGVQSAGSALITATSTTTLTNKTLTAPAINTPTLSGSGGVLTLPAGPDTLVGRATTDTLTNKTVTGMATASTVKDGLGNLYNVGYRSIPLNTQTGTYTLVKDDVGKFILGSNGGAAQTITIPPTSTGSWVEGDAMLIVSNDSGVISVTQGAGVTIRLAGTTTTGTRTISQFGQASLLYLGSNTWTCSGVGVA